MQWGRHTFADGEPSLLAHSMSIVDFWSIASFSFIAFGGLGWEWWPFNIMATLLSATLCAWLIEVGGPARLALACVPFIVGGAFVSGLGSCALGWRHRLALRRQRQLVGACRVAAHLCCAAGQADPAARSPGVLCLGVLCLLPGELGGAVGSGTAAANRATSKLATRYLVAT